MAGMGRGFSLLELVVVLAVLAATAGLVVPLISSKGEDAKMQVTSASLARVRDVIMGSGEQRSYWADMRTLPVTVCDLFVKPLGAADYDKNTRLGWRGPYLQSNGKTYAVDSAKGFFADYGSDGDPTLPDGWNNSIVIQIPTDPALTNMNERSLYARVVSAGADGAIQTPLNVAYPSSAMRGDDLLLFLRRADVP